MQNNEGALNRERDEQNLAARLQRENIGRGRPGVHLRFSLVWRRCDGVNIPEHSVSGGKEGGTVTYVGRAEHEGQEIPGRVVPGNGCYVSYEGGEHRYDKYDVLVNDGNLLKWIRSSAGTVPSKAIVGGKTTSGEELYIGRTEHDGSLILGRIQPSHGCLYIPCAGAEHRYTDYEVLVTEFLFPIG
ncbi:natterin-4-like [Amblyomma americanum]